MNIEVILTQDDPKLGKKGQVVKVSTGFAHNFLIPHSKAKLATAGNLKSAHDEKERQAKLSAKALADAREIAKKIESTSLTVSVQAGEADKLYGAVTSQEIQEELARQAIKLERKDIHLEEPIKKLGAYEIKLKIHPEVVAKLKLWVVKKN